MDTKKVESAKVSEEYETADELEDKGPIKLDNDNYSCPNCNAQLSYIPEKMSLHCEYCGYEEKLIGESSNLENVFNLLEIEDNSWKDEVKVVRCENCGAENVISVYDIASECPFCGSSQIVQIDELPGKKPDRVIAFRISSDNSRELFSKWIKRKLYVPKKVKKDIPSIKINGVYLPCWTYDANSISEYKGRLGKRYTVTVGSGKNRRTETRIRWFYIKGTEFVDFDDVITNAGNKINASELSSIEPFNTNESFVYEQKFLAGFSAEHYKINVQAGWKNVQPRMKNYIKTRILSHYHYDVVGYLNFEPVYKNITYKYVLLPIWIGAYSYNKKDFRFIVNGENGKITGKYPISAPKVIVTVLIIFIVLFLLIYGFMNS